MGDYMNNKIIIISIIILLISILSFNSIKSERIDLKSNHVYNNHPPQIIRSLTYYDKYNDILYIAARDQDNDKICIGIDWNRDHIIDEWSDYRKIMTRWEFDCNGITGIAYYIAEDEHGARSEWHQTMQKSNHINQNLDIISYMFHQINLIVK